MRSHRGVSRRQLLTTAAWTTPVVLLATAVPALAASGSTMAIALTSTGLGSGGYDFNLRETKSNANTPDVTLPTGTKVATTTFTITDAATGLPVPGATVTVAGDDLQDGEGNFVIGIWPVATTGTLSESSVKRTATVVSDALGRVTVKIATATWSIDSCPPGFAGAFVPPSGTLSVTSVLAGYTTAVQTYSYLVNDVAGPVICTA